MKRVEIILVPEAQAQAACKGPQFEKADCQIDVEGVYVETETLDTQEPCIYFYPMHQVARVKLVD